MIVDTDPNEACQNWKAADPDATDILVVSERDEKNILSTIRQHDRDGCVVIVDLEGVASMLNSRAMMRSDLVLIVSRAAKVDLDCAHKAAEAIHVEEDTLGRDIAHAVVFTQTPYILTQEARSVIEVVRGSGIDLVTPFLSHRTHYSLLHSYGGGLRQLPEHKSLPNAISEAERLTDSVYGLLVDAIRQTSGDKKAEAALNVAAE
ncbi:Protein parA [Salipiger mucosus DSM 16094]|uniref:Protein parA n=1 Tax=Salipiger mucosus DSM 16094 TaxID=1123237 RepID=S9SCP9_9RHOB|nr:Protein parA [Salipiger mucosus DSM 16094]